MYRLLREKYIIVLIMYSIKPIKCIMYRLPGDKYIKALIVYSIRPMKGIWALFSVFRIRGFGWIRIRLKKKVGLGLIFKI